MMRQVMALECRSRLFLFFSSRRRHTRLQGDWSSDVCSSDLPPRHPPSLFRSGCDASTGPCAERLLRVSARAVDRPRDVITAFVLRDHLFPYLVELGGTELRRLGQLERLRIDSTGGRDLDHTDSRGMVFQMLSALRVEGR